VIRRALRSPGLRAERVGDLVLIALFAFVDAHRFWGYLFVAPESFGIDATIYRAAANAWLSGGDPWSVMTHDVYFAGPPPTLLWAVFLVPLSEGVARALWIGLAAGASVWAVRRLGLPMWWILFPPLWISVLTGNPNALVLALLLARLGPLAAVAKIYSVVPLVLLRRWREVLVTALFLWATLFVLPWGMYLASFSRISDVLVDQAAGLSAWGTVLFIPTLFAVLFLGKRGAWLAVPALWPATQIHYATVALPACSRWVAACMAIQIPFAPVLGVSIAVVEELRRARRTAPSVASRRSPSTADAGAAELPARVSPTESHDRVVVVGSDT
jgi:hypothetical protein